MTFRERKAKEDFQTYIKAGHNVTWAACKVVADYRLFRPENSPHDDQLRSLLEIWNRMPRGTRVQYL